MSGDNISQIKERLSVVDVISGYIKVQKSGVNFKARCPFHNEKTPSFYISPERQIWHCFGCQKGGDIFGFVKEIEGVEFKEALQILAQRAGVKLESYDPSVRDDKSVLHDICETAARFFEKQLHHSSVGKKALAYLKDRGLEDETIKEFRLGFAHDDWHSLGNFLRDCGFKDKDIISAGLAISKESGGDMYDRFRSRIIFPIADLNDQVIGFTGRIFEGGFNVDDFPGHQKPTEPGAKYINTPQTLIYDKSRVLYGLAKAKIEARKADRCLLVEGNMDAIMSYQAGVKNVAATSGTALTPSHLQILQRFTTNLDFCFDTDQAGLVATRRGIGLGLSQNFNIKIIHLQDPDCKDPADYVRKFAQNPADGGKSWQELVKTAKPVIDFYFDKLKAELDLASVEGKKAIVSNLGPLIKRLSSQVEKAHWITKLAAVLKTKEAAIEADISFVKDDLDSYTANPKDNIPPIRKELQPTTEDVLLEALLAVVVKKPALFRRQIKEIDINFDDPSLEAILTELGKIDSEEFEFNHLAARFDGDIKMRLEFAYLKSQELLKDFSDEELKMEFEMIVSKFKHRDVSARLASLELDIKAAETSNEKDKLAGLLTKFNELAKKLRR